MKFWNRFKTFKQRGEWVELLFMEQAALRGFTVCKPWGDTLPYDVGIEHGPNFLRVQVKSTTQRLSAGYLCQFKPNYLKKRDYSLEQIDLFAAYVIPADVWYLIPAAMLLGAQRKTMAMLSPVKPPAKKKSYCYECYKDAWSLLTKNRSELVREGRQMVRSPSKNSRKFEQVERSFSKAAYGGNKIPRPMLYTGRRFTSDSAKGKHHVSGVGIAFADDLDEQQTSQDRRAGRGGARGALRGRDSSV